MEIIKGITQETIKEIVTKEKITGTMMTMLFVLIAIGPDILDQDVQNLDIIGMKEISEIIVQGTIMVIIIQGMIIVITTQGTMGEISIEMISL